MNCAPVGSAKTIIRATQPNHRPVTTSLATISPIPRPASGTAGIIG